MANPVNVYCRRCRQKRIHQVHTPYPTPHLIYLLAVIFCCGVALPVWALHIAVDYLSPRTHACSACLRTYTTRNILGGIVFIGLAFFFTVVVVRVLLQFDRSLADGF